MSEWKVVPVEPTLEMIEAMRPYTPACEDVPAGEMAMCCYEAALAAAPSAPAGPKDRAIYQAIADNYTAPAVPAPDPNINVKVVTEDKSGSWYPTVLRVEPEDDGSYTAVILHSDTGRAASAAPAPTLLERAFDQMIAAPADATTERVMGFAEEYRHTNNLHIDERRAALRAEVESLARANRAHAEAAIAWMERAEAAERELRLRDNGFVREQLDTSMKKEGK